MKHTIEAEIKRQVFRNEESGWSIYAVYPVEDANQFKLNQYRNITVRGKTRPLQTGKTYKITIDGPHTDPKFGDNYDLEWVEPEKLDTIESQDAYLQSLLTERQFISLKEAYPNDMLLDIIMSDQVDVNKTKGIKDSTLAKIKDKLNSNSHISVLVSYLSELELSVKTVEKIMEHFETPDLAVAAIRNNIYSLCKIKTFGFKTIDKIALGRGDNPTNINRIKACIDHILYEDLQKGHTWSIRSEVEERAENLLGIRPSFITEAIEQFISKKILRGNDSRLAFAHVIKEEVEVARHLERIYNSYATVQGLDEKVDYRIKMIEDQQGFKFTEEQDRVIRDGMKHGVMVLNGKAGSGKTTLVKGLLDVLGTDNYMTCGLSGKSAQVLSQRGIKSSTIHRMLGYTEGDFTFNEDFPLSYDAVVVDEISMTNVSLLLNVLKAVPDGCKLILVGDSGQLPAIGYGDVLKDLLSSRRYPTYELTQVHRQAEKSGILSLANSVRDGNQIIPYGKAERKTFGVDSDQVVIGVESSDKESIPVTVISIAEEYKSKVKTYDDLFEFQVLVANKERGSLSVRNLNLRMQAIFNDTKKPFLLRNGYNFRQGDKIISQGNSYGKRFYSDMSDYKQWYQKDRSADMAAKEKVDVDEEEASQEDRNNKADVFNGTMGYIYEIDSARKVAIVKFENSPYLYPFTQEDMEKIDMAYAITVHKSQGSAFKDLVFAIDFGAFTLLNRQLVYTAITRASRKGIILCETNAMYQAINTDASGMRRTTLGELLMAE